MKIERLLQTLWGRTPIFGQFLTKTLKFTTDLGDIEQIRPSEEMESVFRIISPRQEAEFHSPSAQQRAYAFFRCWTMKEACVKAHGTSLSTPLDSIEVLMPYDTPQLIDCRGFRCLVLPFGPHGGYAGALALEQDLDCETAARVILHSEMVCSCGITDARSFTPVVGRNWEESRVRGGEVWI